MKCDLCPVPIQVGYDDFVVEEFPTNDPDATLLKYVAHKRCHEAAQGSDHWSFLWP